MDLLDIGHSLLIGYGYFIPVDMMNSVPVQKEI